MGGGVAGTQTRTGNRTRRNRQTPQANPWTSLGAAMTRRLATLAALALVSLIGPQADARQPLIGEPDEGLESNRYMEYKNPKAWVVKGQYFVYPDGQRIRNLTDWNGWVYESLEIVLPYVTQSGNAWTTKAQSQYPVAEININHRNQNALFEAVKGHVPGTEAAYMVFKAPTSLVVDRIQFSFANALVCAETRFDEKAAWDVPWPSRWPRDAAAWLERDAVLDLDDEQGVDQVRVLLDRWTGGNDPRQIPPVQLAKFLTGHVIEHVRTSVPASENPAGRPPRIVRSGTGSTSTSSLINLGGAINISGMISGLNAQDAGKTAVAGIGSPHDYAVLLTAVFRRAGIPARTVIGVDKNTGSRQKQVKSWVEFALVAPDVDRVIWVPIDIWELRSSGRNTRNWQQPWKHFGTCEQLRDTVPVAFHFHPPANYRSYFVPALYGIRSETELDNYGVQGLIFEVNSQPNRAGG